MLTRQHCCPTSDGGGAAIIASEDFVKKHGLEHKAVEIVGQAMVSDLPGSLDEEKTDLMTIAGYKCSKTAAEKVYAQAGINPKDIKVVELHDCFSANELITYEALQLCEEGKAGEFIDAGENTYGGRVVVNPSGGLISKGHPLGATGLAQCAELCWQLRGEADKRQVENCDLAVQHNIGLGSAVVITGMIFKNNPFLLNFILFQNQKSVQTRIPSCAKGLGRCKWPPNSRSSKRRRVFGPKEEVNSHCNLPIIKTTLEKKNA